MIIRKMRATFGKLDNAELKLKPGLNVISGANETGKSTWMAFLLAMLYGVDTKDRAKAGRLPDKMKYQPWSGKPMSGTMELSVDGKSLTLERSSQTAPMGDFRAWDTDTGTPREDLTGKSCGQTLLGVEAAVYARSGCLRQHRLSVSADAQLEKRLSGLVTAGNEDYAYAEIEDRLKKMQNALRSSQGGAIPRAEEARRELDRRLGEIADSQHRLSQLEAEIAELKQRREQCREILDGLDALDRRERQSRADSAEEALRQAQEDRESWEQVCADLPREDELQALQAQLEQLQQDLERAALDEGLSLEELSLPEPDPVFGRMSPKEAHDKAAADIARVQEAKTAKRPRRRPYFLWLLLCLAGIGLGFYGALRPILPLMAGGVGLALLGLVIWMVRRIGYIRRREAFGALQREARGLLERYEARGPKDMLNRAMAYIRAFQDREDPENDQHQRELEDLADRRAEIYQQIETLMPGSGTPEKAAALFQEAANARQELERARMLEDQRREQARELRLAVGASEALPPEAERFAAYDRETEQNRMEALELELEATSSQADKLAGAIGQMGEPLALEAERERLTGELRRMEERYSALRLARSALSVADESLRAKFAPMLCEKTGVIFSRLTAGKYDGIQLDRSMHITVHPVNSSVYRPLSYLSGGTVDQLYLALRLAICELLLPDAPIVLDDALVYFDDKRAELALQTLRELSKTRQVLIFTCQSREKRLLDKLAKKK